jgi:hypothetical protein
VTPPELAPATSLQAPLLSMDPLVTVEPIEPGPPGSGLPPEGVRVRTTVGQRHGVDLTEVPLDRSSDGATRAREVGARAFTSDRAIVIPPDVGSLETGPGEALFAHELTHVAQRARFGATLPDASTPAGRALEVEALSAELALAPAGSAPLEWPEATSHPPASGLAGDRVSSWRPAAELPLAAAPASGPDIDSLAASILDKMSGLSAAQPMGATTEVFTAPWSSSPAPAPAVPAPVQRADVLSALAPRNQPPSTGQDEPAGPFSTRPSDRELNNLSRWLYPLIKYRLKGELREDRERAGLLTDHYRKW